MVVQLATETSLRTQCGPAAHASDAEYQWQVTLIEAAQGTVPHSLSISMYTLTSSVFSTHLSHCYDLTYWAPLGHVYPIAKYNIY